jgi:hypothetical protein
MAKRYPTAEDIAEMRARGYDQFTVEEAVKRSKRGEALQRLKHQIEAAFAEVSLGSGIGLYEAQALDGYANEDERAKCRERDEKDDWRTIPAKRLNECYSSLSFFDGEGMRFHLPAFLIADLDGNYEFGMDYCLTLCPGEQFALLNTAQAETVRDFLRFIEDEPDYALSRERIRHAIDEYWVA